MLIKVEWTATRFQNGDVVEYYVKLPSGAIAYARFRGDVWLGIVQLPGKFDQTARFATAYDAQTAIEFGEAQRLIDLGIQAAAANRDRSAPTSSVNNTAHVVYSAEAC